MTALFIPTIFAAEQRSLFSLGANFGILKPITIPDACFCERSFFLWI